jgi:tRNA threonylcarbamoyladenosine biosynthesis protein TsaE
MWGVTFTFTCKTVEDTQSLAAAIGGVVKGGEVLAFHSDLGGGKTAFVKGMAKGMGVTDVVQSPTFTISQIHAAGRGLELHHYDFYRLGEAGIMSAELAESLAQSNAVVAIEWGDIVRSVLPEHYIHVTLGTQDNEARLVTIECPQTDSHVVKALQNYQQNRADS